MEVKMQKKEAASMLHARGRSCSDWELSVYSSLPCAGRFSDLDRVLVFREAGRLI